jgi:peptidoglycan/xylan/chitin deacetylase (PgdA/CDA1 family)
MLDYLKRWAGAQWLRTSGRVARDREELYGAATGLRIVAFHETALEELEQVKRLVDWCSRTFEMATPADADALFEGRWRPGPVDRLLDTFDDGLASNHQVARWLADMGIQAIFFLIPSLIDRSLEAYLRFHQQHGVTAFPPLARHDSHGLASSQVREMMAMGHRIGAHNFAHRDLGQLRTLPELRYEVDNALDAIGTLTGQACRDFAVGFGQPENVSDEAAAHLLERCPHVFNCHRGLNVPGRTSRFALRHGFDPSHPEAFTRISLEGGADRHLAGRAREMVRRVGVLPAGPLA